MKNGGLVHGENYAWPRVEIRLFQAGEDEPCHVITTPLTRNPSRRLGDVIPIVERFTRELDTRRSHAAAGTDDV